MNPFIVIAPCAAIEPSTKARFPRFTARITGVAGPFAAQGSILEM